VPAGSQVRLPYFLFPISFVPPLFPPLTIKTAPIKTVKNQNRSKRRIKTAATGNPPCLPRREHEGTSWYPRVRPFKARIYRLFVSAIFCFFALLCFTFACSEGRSPFDLVGDKPPD
jgi:hypothetical protein